MPTNSSDNENKADFPSSNSYSRRRFLKTFVAGSLASYGVIAAGCVPQGRPSGPNALPFGWNSQRLRNKPTILITGSSSGFGYITAKHMAKNGYHVIASMRNVQGANQQAASELEEFAKSGKYDLDVVEIDVDSDYSVRSGVNEAILKTGGIDILFNNAGINIPGPIELSMDAARQNFETNVFGQLRLLRAVAPGMRNNRDGLIIQMSSGLGRFVMPTSGMYCATKFAQEAMFEAAAYELHNFGVEIAIIQPSDYNTKIKENSRRYFKTLLDNLDTADQKRAADYQEQIDVTRATLADSPAPPPQEVADIVLKLAQTPAGQRPLRQVAMPPEIAEGTNQLNGTLEEVQSAILNSSGLGSWLELAW